MNQCYNRTISIRAEEPLTNFSVKDLFLSVANRFNNLEEGLKEPEVTQPPSLIIEFLPLCFLQAEKKGCVQYSTLCFS